MESYFIALIPDDKTRANILEAKLSIFKNFGDQKFLSDVPHCTLYVSLAEDLKAVEEIIKQSLENQQKINTKIEDWQIFAEDKLAGGGSTIGLKIGGQKTNIIELQKKLVNQLNHLRNNQIPLRFQTDLPDSLRESTEKYGYPFVSSNTVQDILLPHISFCSFKNPENIQKFQQSNPIHKLQGPITFTKLALFKLHENDRSELIKDFLLQ